MTNEATPTKEITSMDSGLYRKNVMKTLSVKPAKQGLVLTARNTERTNIQHAAHGFASEALEFQRSMRRFLIGEQLSKIDPFAADGPQIELGDGGYYLQVMAKALKIKALSAKKKVKLQGSLTEAILDYVDLAEQVLDLTKKTFYGPQMKQVEKDVRNPSKGVIEKRQVWVIDKEAEAGVWADRKASLAAVVTKAMEQHAMLCLAILGTTAGPVNLANIKKLNLRYPDGQFEYEHQAKKNPQAEAQAAQAQATTALAA